jgi:nucleotide-binding universal stress UspA family protein
MDTHKSGLRTVIVGVDFTPASERVAAWVARRLPAKGTTLLVHALEIDRQSGETSAQRQIRLEAAESAHESLTRLGAEFFADRHVQGHPRLEKFVGSTAQRLIHESLVPVLLAVGI